MTRRLSAVALLALLPSAAAAHAVDDVAGGLVSGLLHPVLGPDHLIAMVAVGLWGAQLGAPLVYALPVAFPLMMAVGGLLGVLGLPLPGVQIGIAVSALLLGLAVLFALRLPSWLAVALVGLFAIFHGHAHGTALPGATEPLAYGLGFVVMTGLLHMAGIVIGLLNDVKTPGPSIVRGCGGIIAGLGAYFLAATI